jgi:muconolactone delta-isomerase
MENRTMEFLVDFDLTTPERASADDIGARTEAEGAASAELARAGHLKRLWTVGRAPGRWRGLGLYRAANQAELDALLRALPCTAGWTSRSRRSRLMLTTRVQPRQALREAAGWTGSKNQQ